MEKLNKELVFNPELYEIILKLIEARRNYILNRYGKIPNKGFLSDETTSLIR